MALSGGKRCRTLALFRSMGAGGLPHPCTFRMSVAARGKPLRIARPITLEDLIEFGPIDGPELMLLLRLVPTQQGVGNDQIQELGLRHREIHELLTQLIVREALYFPTLRLAAMRRVGVGGSEH